MQYTKLGNTDIQVSRICVGGMSFGEVQEGGHQWLLGYEDSKRMISHALELGVNFIDTANTYARGTSEQFIGKALRELGIPRDQVVIATKVFFNLTTDKHLTKEAIAAEIDGSLQRLQTDYVDLYQIHRFDYDTPIEETMEALDTLVKAGKVRAIGASAMYGYQFHNMQVAAEKNGWTKFSTMQNHYNLLYREDEREMIPVCKQYNVSLIPYSPLAGGHLSHIGWTTDSKRSQTDQVMRRKYDKAMDNDLEIIEQVHQVAERHGVSMTQVALAWLLKKGVAAPIVGATKVPHFDDAVTAVDLTLSDEDMRCLEAAYQPHVIEGAI